MFVGAAVFGCRFPLAAAERYSLATATNDMRFDNRYCWIVVFEGARIVRVRAYLDTAMVVRLFKENPIT